NNYTHLPKEIIENILKSTNSRGLVSARGISRRWRLVAESRFLNKRTHIFIDFLRIYRASSSEYLELSLSSTMPSIITVNIVRYGKGRTISVHKSSKENVNVSRTAIRLEQKLTCTRGHLKEIATLMSHQSVRVFCLQSAKEIDGVSL
ncbi:hypothetical protein PFISCL1PPCAC_10935, partial [Pristionchus fissidentatus]